MKLIGETVDAEVVAEELSDRAESPSLSPCAPSGKDQKAKPPEPLGKPRDSGGFYGRGDWI